MSHTELTLNRIALAGRAQSGFTRDLSTIEPWYTGPAVFVTDLVSIVCGSVGSGVAYQLFYGSGGRVREFLSLALLIAALVLPVLHLRGHYEPKQLVASRASLYSLVSTWICVFLFLAVVAFGLKVQTAFSGGWIHLFFSPGFAC